MKKMYLIPLFVLLLIPMAMAWDETYTLNYVYSEGDWNDTHTAEMATDYDYTDFGSCDGYCFVMMNVTTNASFNHYDSNIWGINFTDVVDGEDASTYSACWDNNFISFIVMINTSDLENTFLGCENVSEPNSWLPLDASYNASGGGGNISGMYLYINDITPTVTMDDSINGTEKECVGGVIESDIIFEADDPTDVEMDCCVVINGVVDASSCNSSIQDETTSVLHTDALLEGSNTVWVRCYDETHYGDSNSMTLDGEYCNVCDNMTATEIALWGLIALACIAGLLFFVININYISIGSLLVGIVSAIIAIVLIVNVIKPIC